MKVSYSDITTPIVSLIRGIQKQNNILSYIKFDSIKFILSNYEKDSAVDYYGYCHANNPIFINYTNKKICYIIEIVYNNIKHFDINRLAILVLHELMHIPINGFDINDRQYLETIDHDYNEFFKIMEIVNGINWTDRRNKIPKLIKDKKAIIKKNSITFKRR